jgi:xylose isomerase
MHSYLILKEKAARWNADAEIRALLTEINADDGSTAAYTGRYTPAKAASLRAVAFDRVALGRRGLKYERLDQLTIDILLGAR